LIGFAGADVISGGEGIDGIAGGAGADTINLTELVAAVDTVVFGNTQTSNAGADIAFGALLGADTITGFSAGVVDDVLTFDISAFGLATGTEFVGAIGTLAVDASADLVVLTGVGYASDEAAEDAIAARVTTDGSEMVFGYFNTTTGLTHFVHDTDSGVDGTATTTLIATLSGFTSQALHDTLDTNNVASF
jgi:Ca2+-binding RTX toxin-like protein